MILRFNAVTPRNQVRDSLTRDRHGHDCRFLAASIDESMPRRIRAQRKLPQGKEVESAGPHARVTSLTNEPVLDTGLDRNYLSYDTEEGGKQWRQTHGSR